MEEMYLSEEDKILFDEDFKIIENNKKFPYFLFHSLTDVFPIIKYQDDLFRINDYIYYSEKNLNSVLNYKKELLEEAKNTDVFGEYKYEGIMAREDEVYEIEWMIEVTNKGSNIMLLLSFLEGSLKEIAEWYAKVKNIQCKNTDRPKEKSKVLYYLDKIAICCNYDLISILSEPLKIIDDAKKLRNILVHEWDAYYNENNRIKLDEGLKRFKITRIIDAISKILYMCEYVGLKANIFECSDNIVFKYLLIERQLRLCEYDDHLINIVISD